MRKYLNLQIANIFSKTLMIVSGICILPFFDAEAIGAYSLYVACFAIINTFSGLAYHRSIRTVKRVEGYRRLAFVAITNSIVLSFPLVSCGIIFINLTTGQITPLYAVIYFMASVLGLLVPIQKVFLLREKSYVLLSRIVISRAILSFVFLVMAAILKLNGMLSLLIFLLLQNSLGFVTFFKFKDVKMSLARHLRILKTYKKYPFHLLPSRALQAINQNIIFLTLPAYFPLAVIGQLFIAKRIGSLLTSVLSETMRDFVADSLLNNKRHLIKYSVKLFLLFAMIINIIIILLMKFESNISILLYNAAEINIPSLRLAFLMLGLSMANLFASMVGGINDTLGNTRLILNYSGLTLFLTIVGLGIGVIKGDASLSLVIVAYLISVSASFRGCFTLVDSNIVTAKQGFLTFSYLLMLNSISLFCYENL